MSVVSALGLVAQIAHWSLAAIGLATLGFALALSRPVSVPPFLASIRDTAVSVDYSDMPDLQRFQARDGAWLAYRFYPGQQPSTARIAILAHGSSAMSDAMHGLARPLAAHGVAAYALDMRGHGRSGGRGDIAYEGQLDDDLADFLDVLQKDKPALRPMLIGHSSGGGFALHIAASNLQSRFERAILLAPYLGYDAPSSRPDAGGWARPDLPRILANMALAKIGVNWFAGLPSLAFATGENALNLTSVYSYRLMRNYATNDYRKDLANTSIPIAIFAGGDDELMESSRYAEAIRGFEGKIPIRLIPGVNHMAIVSAPAAVEAIAAYAAGDFKMGSSQ